MVLKIHCDWCNLDFPDASKLNHHLLFHPFHSAQMKRFMRKEPLATPPVDGSSPTIANTWENLLEQQEEEAPVPWLGASATNPPSTPSIIKESHSVGTLLSLLDDPPPPTLTSTPLPVGPPASAASQALLPPELREVQYQANAQHYCTVCRDVSTGLPSYKQHLAGAKHRRMLDKLVTGSRGEVQCEACGGHELRNVDELNEHLELDDRHLRIMVLNMPGSYHKPSLLKASILTSQPVTNLGEGNSLSSPLVSSSSSPSRDQKISSILAQYEESSLGEKSNQVSDTRTNSSSSSSSSTADPLSQRLQDEISLFRVNSTSVEPKPADEREDSQDPWTRSFSTNYRDSSVSGGRHQRRSSPPEYYDMEERGLCVLFNFENFRDRSKRREGAEVDANNLRTVFSSYNFEVEEFKDLKEAIFTRKLDDCVRRLNQRPVSCLVVCIMSHGFEGWCELV